MAEECRSPAREDDVYDVFERGIDKSYAKENHTEGEPIGARREATKGPRKGTRPLDGLIDKAQERRRGARSPDAIDKAIDKAQESGLTDKLAQNIKGRFSRRPGRKR